MLIVRTRGCIVSQPSMGASNRVVGFFPTGWALHRATGSDTPQRFYRVGSAVGGASEDPFALAGVPPA
jgi:hypothetical protein